MALTPEEQSSIFSAEYYATGLGPIPYERSEHWLKFFAIVADELIRALHPRRVLDVGCAMGFLVEAFWDRGVYCEGFDVSPYAISKVRSDVRPYCSVRSVTEPISAKYDLATCIEVLEHLPPEDATRAVANLCSAADVVLFSSSPSDFEQSTHFNVQPSISWLQLFSDFDFWPDARFDAGFVAPHAMVLRKGAPPADDYRALFSEYLRYKGAVATSSEVLKQANRVQAEATAALEHKQEELARTHDFLVEARDDRNRVQQEFAAGLSELVVRQSRWDRELAENRTRAERLKQLELDRQQLLNRLRSLERDRNAERDRLAVQIHRLQQDRLEVQSTLSSALSSRAWKLAEAGRKPIRKMRQDWPRLYGVTKSVARRALGRGGQTAAPPAAPPGDTSENAPEASTVSAAPAAAPAGPPGTNGPAKWSIDPAYDRWIEEQEPTAEELKRQRTLSELLSVRPLFSIVVPVWQPDHRFLRACIQSILDQTYANWELCIAHAPGGDERNLAWLRQIARREPRVHLAELAANKGISGNSNAALQLANGHFVAFLDHDDTFAPFALLEVAARLQDEPLADVVYSDHDYIDAEHGLRCHPLFKPDWSPEIMLSANYITHLTVIRRTLLTDAGPFDNATDGAQDWDLFFRVTERTTRISHIPKILYHWRMHADSTAWNLSAKNYATDAQLLAVKRHMERCEMDAEPEVMAKGLLHVRFRNPPESLVSIIIPTKDRVDLLERCISTLLELTSYPNFEILIVDNASREPSTKAYLQSLAAEARVRIVWHPGAFNFSAVNNRAAQRSKGEFLLFLNNDVEITNPEWLTELVSWANYKPVGIVGAKLLRANGTIQHAGVVLGMSGFADHPFADEPALTFGLAGSTAWYRDFLAVTGACMMMRRQVFEDIGGFDEAFQLCGSDVEICLRAHQQGYRIVYNPFCQLVHHEQQTRGGDVPACDFVESLKHYRAWLANGDPYWNPNLSLWTRQASFRYRGEQSSLQFAERHVAAVGSAVSPSGPPATQEEELLVSWFDCSAEQFRSLRSQAHGAPGFHRVKRVLWFLPVFENPFYGGIFTILRFAEHWRSEEGVVNLFAICGTAERNAMAPRIRAVYPELQELDLFLLDNVEAARDLPDVDASICTLWTTPYYAVHHQHVARRFYFIQDFEPAFYRAGSISALVESTYRMGLYGICNTVSLKKMYESEYGGKATYFKPCINEAVFLKTPPPRRSNPDGPWQVFCYGRPTHGRNAFELLRTAMQHLKASLGDRVRIVSAGGEWNPADFGVSGVIENLGVLAYEDTATLYRESDVGLVMMLTRHPSYIPLELMASRCVTVTNVSSWTSWLLQDGENCVLTYPTATAIADAVERTLADPALRERIADNAYEMVRSQYVGWDREMNKVYQYLCDPEPAEVEHPGAPVNIDLWATAATD